MSSNDIIAITPLHAWITPWMEAGFNAIYYNKLQKFQRSSSELTDSISHKKEQQKQDGPKPKHKEGKLVAALFTFKENPSTNNFEEEDDFEDVLSAMTLDDEKEDVVHFLTTLKIILVIT